MKIKVLIVDDSPLIGEALVALLGSFDGIAVVGEASIHNGGATLAMRLNPHVVLLEISSSQSRAVESAQCIRAKCPGAKLVAIALNPETEYIRQIIRAGVSCFLQMTIRASELVKAIVDVARGEVYFSSTEAKILLTDYVSQLHAIGRTTEPELTNRQIQVLKRIADGNSTKEIAGMIGVSIKTVETYRSQIMLRLQIYNVAGLTKYAIRKGLTVS